MTNYDLIISAVQVMRDIAAANYGPDDNLVALLPDHGSRYTETQFDPDWLAARGINVPEIFNVEDES